jgi:hypothetical protein
VAIEALFVDDLAGKAGVLQREFMDLLGTCFAESGNGTGIPLSRANPNETAVTACSPVSWVDTFDQDDVMPTLG